MLTSPKILATLEGYSVEGGFDRAFEPATCYLPTIALGRHAGPNDAARLWDSYEKVLDHVAELGFDGVALGLEWARLEPRRGVRDDEALGRYHAVARYAVANGLYVNVTLINNVWPAWLGQEAWLLPWVRPHVVAHAEYVVSSLRDVADSFVLFADGDDLARGGFQEGTRPPWRREALDDAASARESISLVEHELLASPSVGPRVTRSFVIYDADETDRILESKSSGDVDEVHVRSLVRGSGPTASRQGLLTLQNGEWVTSGFSELLSALR